MAPIGSFFAAFFMLAYLAIIVFIVWLVISALRRIAKGVEEMAETLRRMEAQGPPRS